MAKSVVLFSPVRLSPVILKETLYELSQLKRDSVALEFWFYDDNDTAQSSALLREFCAQSDVRAMILDKLDLPNVDYHGHNWSNFKLDRVAAIRNHALARFLTSRHDYVFQVDADLCLHPQTLEHLVSLGVPIVGEVWWGVPSCDVYLPNFSFQPYGPESAESTIRLKQPGLYKVGVLAGCTLIRRDAVERGVSFSGIQNLDVPGHDKPFCVRAACLGFDLYGDTTYPAFHVFKEQLVPAMLAWRESGYSYDYLREWLDENWEKRIRKAGSRKPPTRLQLAKKLLKAVIRGKVE